MIRQCEGPDAARKIVDTGKQPIAPFVGRRGVGAVQIAERKFPGVTGTPASRYVMMGSVAGCGPGQEGHGDLIGRCTAQDEFTGRVLLSIRLGNDNADARA